jgi:hypothetical protein
MAYRKHRSSKRSRRNAMKKTFVKGVSMVENTSKKYIPKVKSGLEKVGSKMTTSAEKSVPMLKQASRKFLSIFGIGKTKKHRRH